MARYAPIKAAEEIYSLNWYTLRRWIREGKITGYKLGDRVIRVDLDEIDALMKPLPVTSGGDHNETT
jgi:excisionase family DNA binding protein